jgi:hypothetical protein
VRAGTWLRPDSLFLPRVAIGLAHAGSGDQIIGRETQSIQKVVADAFERKRFGTGKARFWGLALLTITLVAAGVIRPRIRLLHRDRVTCIGSVIGLAYGLVSGLVAGILLGKRLQQIR